MVSLKKGQAVKLYSFTQVILLCLLTVEEIGSTLTKRENQYKIKCIAIRFMNHVGGNFRVISTMKPEGYLVTTDEYKLKTMFRHSQLRHFVIFHGADEGNKKEILLDGEKTISVSPKEDCEHFADVIVTAGDAPVHKEETTFSDTNLPADNPSSKGSMTNTKITTTPTKPEMSKITRQLIQDSDKKGTTIIKSEQYYGLKRQSPTFSDDYKKFITEPPLTASTTKKNLNKLTNVQDTLQTSLNENLTGNYDEDTNITYVDEDETDNETKLKYNVMTNGIDANGEGFRNGDKNNVKTSEGKSKYSAEIKRLKDLLPLLAKYKSLNFDKNNKNNEKQSNDNNISLPGKPDHNDEQGAKTQSVLSDSHLKGSPELGKKMNWGITRNNKQLVKLASFHTKKKTWNDDFGKVSVESTQDNNENGTRNMKANDFNHAIHKTINKQNIGPRQSHIAPSRIVNSQKSSKTTITLDSQKAGESRTPKQSKITLGKTISMQTSQNGGTKGNSLQTIVHHTKLTNKDGTLDIVNKLQQSPEQKPHIIGPKVIHSKEEAIGEIFRALGSNSKIVKDANGLYLISGKHVKIIHRSHGGVNVGRNINENERATSIRKSGEDMENPKHFLSKDFPSNSTPLLQINSTNYQQSLNSNALNIQKKFGLDLSNYNLRDFGHKPQDEPKLGFWRNEPNENIETTNTVLPPKARDDLNVDNKNKKQPQRKFNNDSYFNSTPNELKNEKDNLHASKKFTDAYSNGAVPNPVNNTALPGDENNHFSTSIKQSKWKFTDAYSNSTVPNPVNNTAFIVKENNNLHMSNVNRKQSQFNDSYSNRTTLSERPFMKNSHPLKDVENHSSVPGSFTSNSKDDSSDNQNASDQELSDVEIEVVDEAKEGNSEFENNSTEVKEDTENLEIIDEGRSNQSALKITPEDVSSALHEQSGNKGVNVNKSTEIAEENGAGSPGIISLRNESKPGTWSDISSFNYSVASPDVTQSTVKTRFGFKKLKLPLKNSGALEKTESKSLTSGPTWSMDIQGVVGTPKDNASKLPNGLQTMKIIPESQLRTQSLQPASNNKNVKGASKITNVSDKPMMVSKQGEGGTTRITNLPREPMMVSKQGEQGKTRIPNLPREPMMVSKQGEQRTTDLPREPIMVSKQGEQGATSITNLPREPMMVSKQGEQKTTRITDLPREPMIPKRIVNALLLSIAQRLQRKNEYIPVSNHRKDKDQAGENDTTGMDNHALEDIKYKSRTSNFKNMLSEENPKLDNLLEKFVKLVSRRGNRIKTVKRKPRVKPQKKIKILDSTPLLRRQEKLLWDEQRKLERELELEKKLLVGSMGKENIDSSKSFSTNNEVNLKKKIEELNIEKKYLLNKVKMHGFQGKFGAGDNGNQMFIIPDRETSLTEVYDGSGLKTSIAPYVGSHVTHLLNDKELKKETGFESKLEHTDERLRQLLVEYDSLVRSPDGGKAEATEFNEDTRNNYEDHTRTTPSTAAKFDRHLMGENRNHEMFPLENGFTEINNNPQELHKGKSTNIRDFDIIPRNTAKHISEDEAFGVSSSENESQKVSHVSTSYPTYPTYQRTPDYINTHQSQNDANLYKSDPTLTKSVFSNPTLSFINKEADYASDTAEKFEDSFRQSKTVDDINSENLDQQEKNSHSDYKKSSGGQGRLTRVNNVSPGTYNYNEGREGTQSTPNWRREDEKLLKEMPEYSAEDNTIESEVQPEHYTVMTMPKDLEIKPQDKSIAGSYSEVKPKVTNTVNPVGNENTRIQNLMTGNLHQPKATQELIPKTFSQRSYSFGPDRSEASRQQNSIEGINSKMYPQTTNIVESNDMTRVSGNELRSSFRKEGRLGYTNPEFHQPEVNHIANMGSEVEKGGYYIPTSGRVSETQGMPAVTSSMGSESNEEGESRFTREKSRQPMENEIDGAFDVVDGGEEPTLQRNTDNPEDGVEDKTYINGDEYHLQKKHRIETNKNKSKQ